MLRVGVVVLCCTMRLFVSVSVVLGEGGGAVRAAVIVFLLWVVVGVWICVLARRCAAVETLLLGLRVEGGVFVGTGLTEMLGVSVGRGLGVRGVRLARTLGMGV